MAYYNIFNFKKEPFSNSPEPEFLFSSPQHVGCLQKLELSIRLRRGLSVVIGDIGTGKTTLCRKLIQNLSPTEAQPAEIETHLLLDPSFSNNIEFLQNFCEMLRIKDRLNEQSEWELKEKIKNYLFAKGVDEGKIVVLVIDEGQKICEGCLELLREFLNYETNDCKLLQIIIFAQKEFRALLKNRPNLADRVSVFYHLKPLNFKQTRAMIKYRLSVARNFEIAPPVFSRPGFAAVYLSAGGYPRKIVSLCHDVIIKLIIRNRQRAGWFLVRSCAKDMAAPAFPKIKWAAVSLAVILALVFSARTIISEYDKLQEARKGSAASVADGDDQATAVAGSSFPLPDGDESVQEKGPEGKTAVSLGMMTMKKGMTLWWILYDMYGDTGKEIMDAVLKVNPQIKNEEQMQQECEITLPLITAQAATFKNGKFVVFLEEGEDIEKIYDFFNKNRYLSIFPPLVFSPCWNTLRNSVKFAVVLDRNFNTAEEAVEAIKRLPPELASGARIVSSWDEGTVFLNHRALQS